MRHIIGFSTYPVKVPLHGGQRRICAFAEYYRSIGISYECVSIYDSRIYRAPLVGAHDIAIGQYHNELDHLPFIDDLRAGWFAASDDLATKHFSDLILSRAPMAISLEQPFLWPLLKKLRENPHIAAIPIIYSSQNWEAPLKSEILSRSGIPLEHAAIVKATIQKMEGELVESSNLIFAVSEDDARIYRSLAGKRPVVVVRNGVSRPMMPATSNIALQSFGNSRYFFFVGSAYPPNSEGFCALVLHSGLFFVPPEKTFAICGGTATGIFSDPRYQKFLGSNSDRCELFVDITDNDLNDLKSGAHAVLLPINFGGGSNLKTAEALVSCKWVIATSTALRGFDDYANEPGVVVANDPFSFRKAIMETYHAPPLKLTEQARTHRERLFWDRCFDTVRENKILDMFRSA